MFGLDLKVGLQMLTKLFDSEKLESIVVHRKEGVIEFEKLSTNLLEEFRHVVKNSKDATEIILEYRKSKTK